MQELSERLKNKLVETLVKNPQNVDEPYIVVHFVENGEIFSKKLTRRQLSEEIKNETELGVEQMTKLIMLSLDLLAREKIK